MITEDLINFIQTELKKNVTEDRIIERLIKAGWHRNDIDEGIRRVNPPNLQTKPNPDVDKQDALILKQKPIIPRVIEPKNAQEQEIEQKPTLVTYVLPEEQEVKSVSSNKQNNVVFSPQTPTEVKPVFSEELIPALKPKESATYKEQTNNVKISPIKPINSTVPDGAILSTLSRDILNSGISEGPINQKTNNKRPVFLILAIVFIISVISGIALAMSGYISLPKFSLIKKDPKQVLLQTPQILSKLASYKVDNNIKVSFPSFSNITNGLVSGENINSNDQDYISLSTSGYVIKNNSNFVSDHNIKIDSSLIKSSIDSHIQYNGSISFVKIPDLSFIFKDYAPNETNIAITNNEWKTLLPLMGQRSYIIKNIDKHNILENGLPSSILLAMEQSLFDLINASTKNENGEDYIKDNPTYHYQMSVDRASTKKFLSEVFNMFTPSVSENNKKMLNEIIGATTIDSLDVWVGKNDDMLYQYKIVFTTPLSKIINLEDKGIAGNKVSLSVGSTFYEFNKTSTILTPQDVVPVLDFTKSVQDQKLKVLMNSFKEKANALKNTEGSFGLKPNLLGDCTNPVSGSLFSPVGHIKNTTNPVGDIAILMNSILSISEGGGKCISDPKAWAISLPLSKDEGTFYCVDSKGNNQVYNSIIAKSSCN